MSGPNPILFGLVGTGWRAEFYARVARACPERFRIAGVTGRTPERVEAFARKFGVSIYDSIDDLVARGRPLFVVTSVSWDVNPEVVTTLAELGMPVLSETPPARTVEEMSALCEVVRDRGVTVQVAEQYFLQPHHAARLALAHAGRLGRVTQAQVSAAHGYHGISLIRKYLGIGYENVCMRARQFESPVLTPPHRGEPTEREELTTSRQTLAWFDFGDRLGVFDFANEQYFSPIRNPRILVRGERGEILGDRVHYVKTHPRAVSLECVRHEAGQHGNLEGQYLKGIQLGEDWVYENPVAPARLADDEIAIADCLLRMASHVRGGPMFYPLAEACQDRYLDILLGQAVETGETIKSETQPWVD